MRYGKDHKQETHARIVKKASVRLRERGVHGIGVADLMKDAGLTHGGFYAHFASREALVIEAFVHAMDRSNAAWRKKTAGMPPEERFATIVESYLGAAHRDDPGRGCPLPALAAEIGRESIRTRRAFAAQLEAMIAMMAEQMPDLAPEAARRRAMAALSTMVGALILSRAGGGELSDEILAASREALLGPPAPAGRRPRKNAAKAAVPAQAAD